jgi:hypothetical protein
MTVPAYLTIYVLARSAAVILTILFGLRAALAQAEWPARDRIVVVWTAALILVGWFALAALLGAAGAFHANAGQLPSIQYGLFLPILVGALLIWRSATVRRVIEAIPQAWIVGIQLYRALGVIFLILYANDKLPGLFAWPAGLGDILVAVLAPVVAIAYARAPRENTDLVTAWNVFGIFDLVVAVGTGFATSPSQLQLLALDRPNELVSLFPLVLVPAYLVPLSILLHLASLAKLRMRSVIGRRRELDSASAI